MPLYGFDSICQQKQPIIVSKDYGEPRKHIAHNRNGNDVTHYRIDGVVITFGNKCDFLLINETTYVAYLIELKGSDLDHAAFQLESTEIALKGALKDYHLEFRIVVSKAKTQAIESTSFKKFRVRKKRALIYRTNQIEEDI